MSTRWIPTILALALGGCAKPPAEGDAGTPAQPAARETAQPAARAAQGVGQRIFNNTCIACHQENGTGIPGLYPSLAGSPIVRGDPGVLARWVVLHERPPTMPEGRYTASMPQFGWLSTEEAASLLTYVRSSFGNSATAVDEATVAKALGE